MSAPTLPTELQGEMLWASLAVLIDGEGCIRIHRHIPSRTHKSPRYYARIQVVNTNRVWMQAWRDATNLGFLSKPHQSKTTCRERTDWKICSADAVKTVLTNIQPYLFCKRPQADLALEFINNVKFCRQGRYHTTPPEETAWRESIFQKMKVLNQRGPVDNPVSCGPRSNYIFQPAEVLQ